MRITNAQIMETMNTMNNMLMSVVEEQKSLRAEIDALKGGKVSVEKTPSKKSTTSKKTTAPKTKTSTKSSTPTKAQLDARKAWGEAQHARAEARKELFAIVDTPEYKKEWSKWQKTKAYKESKGAERKALNKERHAQIVAKLSK